ncbi:MAG: type I-C CRISPR-associated protein Cas8c/Csd1 [Syntrophobacteraceae bacterium]
MSWLEKLYRTYENNVAGIGDSHDRTPLFPICHTAQNAQVEIVVDGWGNFLRASVIRKDDALTIVPCTEASAGRVGIRPVNHPLCDKLQYVAGDFFKFGGEVTVGFKDKPSEPYEMYRKDLLAWCSSSHAHPKAVAVFEYIDKERTLSDLIDAGVLHTGLRSDGPSRLIYEWEDGDSDKPEIFKLLTGKMLKGGIRSPWQADAFVRWAVESPGELNSSLVDPSLQNAWIRYSMGLREKKGFCYVTGGNVLLADSHPAKLRNSGDKAKLISSNDTSGFTYRGRFTDGSQVAGVGFEITEKAHSALRWLLGRQGRVFSGLLGVVAWAVSGADVPDPLANTDDLFEDGAADSAVTVAPSGRSFTAQEFGIRLSKFISGYSVELGHTEEIIVMAIDSATPGRMAITYHRQLTGSDFLERISSWHQESSWLQRFSKDKVFYGAASPADIAEVAYGHSLDDNLRRATIECLIPCIIDGAPIPGNIVASCVRMATRRETLPAWAWEKALGVACGLYRYSASKRERYTMGLDRERRTRDYLYGRLLAVADCIESWALRDAKEDRPTSATRLMQRFADRPFQTWRTIELGLSPYIARMGHRIRRHLGAEEEIMNLFDIDDFKLDRPLTGEFLLGFHCQRAELLNTTKGNVSEKGDGDESDE